MNVPCNFYLENGLRSEDGVGLGMGGESELDSCLKER